MSDTTTPEQGSDAPEPIKGLFIRYGLKNGQTLMALTTEEIRIDGPFYEVEAENGEVVLVRISEVAYIRETVVDMPTEEEIAAAGARLEDRPLSSDEIRTLTGGAYL